VVHSRLQIEKPANYAPKNEKLIRIMDRKNFFTTAGRLLLLGGMAASAGYLVLNRKVSATCTESPTCKNCGKFAKCELPQAKETKEITPKE
jgi:hypothetical protein